MKNGDFWGREQRWWWSLFFPVGVPVPSGLSMRTTIVRLTTIHNLEEQSIVNMQKSGGKWSQSRALLNLDNSI